MKLRRIRKAAQRHMGDEVFMRRLTSRVVLRMVQRAIDNAMFRVVREVYRQRAEFFRDLGASAEAILPGRFISEAESGAAIERFIGSGVGGSVDRLLADRHSESSAG